MAPKIDLSEIREKIDFGIITIREDEFRSVLRRFPKYAETEGNQRYVISAIETITGDYNLLAIVRCPEQGEGEGQNVARNMILDLNPNWLILVGIAGGVPSDEYTLGDVVVATRLHDFSVGADIENRGIEYEVRGGPMHPAVKDLLGILPSMDSELGDWNNKKSIGMKRPAIHLRSSNFYGDEDWVRDTRGTLMRHFGKNVRPRGPKVITGSIASSDRLIKNTSTIAEWRKSARQIQAVEMELAGVYQAARQKEREYPILAIRGISDIVGFKRHQDWTTYACHSAASFTFALLKTRVIKPRDSRFAKKIMTINENVIQSPKAYQSVDASAFVLPINQITEVVAEAESLAKSAYENFDLSYTSPADCDLVYDTIKMLWDEKLFKVFSSLENIQKVPARWQSPKVNNDLLAGMISNDVQWIIRNIREFREVCLREDTAVKETRYRIREKIGELDKRIKSMLNDMTGNIN